MNSPSWRQQSIRSSIQPIENENGPSGTSNKMSTLKLDDYNQSDNLESDTNKVQEMAASANPENVWKNKTSTYSKIIDSAKLPERSILNSIIIIFGVLI